MCLRKRSRASGMSLAPPSSTSMTLTMAASGVLSSCAAFSTNSRSLRRARDETVLLVLPRRRRRGRGRRRTAVVVEHRVHGLRLGRELFQAGHPFAQLVLGVEVVEPLRGAPGSPVPGLGVAAVKADVSGFARGGGDRGEDVLAAGSGRVDRDVGHPVLFEEAKRVGAVLLVEPASVAELDEHLVAMKLLLRPFEVLERLWLVDDVRRELHQDSAKLPGRAERPERLAVGEEHLGAGLARGTVGAG